MKAWQLEVLPAAKRALAKLEPQVLLRLDEALQRLLVHLEEHEAPPPATCKRMQGGLGLWRLRQGDWRVIFKLEAGRLTVLVFQVGHRSEVYRKRG